MLLLLIFLFLLLQYPFKPINDTKSKHTTSSFICTDEKLPILMSLFMGLQHCFCMVGGLITPPLVVFKFSVCGFAEGFCPELVQVSYVLLFICLFWSLTKSIPVFYCIVLYCLFVRTLSYSFYMKRYNIVVLWSVAVFIIVYHTVLIHLLYHLSFFFILYDYYSMLSAPHWLLLEFVLLSILLR